MRFAVVVSLILLAAASAAQQAPPVSFDPHQIAAREFGPGFQVSTKVPPLIADLDGDGQPDVVIVATAKNPLANEAEFHYKVIDPYDAYFGFGDPKVTVQFTATNVGETRYLLVVHNWAAPKAKFVMINVPFDRLSEGKLVVKKKTLTTIHAAEAGGLSADIFWDGKKYRWEPNYLGE